MHKHQLEVQKLVVNEKKKLAFYTEFAIKNEAKSILGLVLKAFGLEEIN